jgi:hypothetical protein
LSSGALPTSGLFTAENIFRFFKYSIYILLAYNVFLFFEDDLVASAQTFAEDITWRNVIEAYSATFDTAAWVALLLLFELETAVIPDQLLKSGLKWTLHGLRALAYFVIIYSFYGYCVKYGVVTNLQLFNIADVCKLVGTDFTWVVTLDEYLPIDQAACTALQGQALLQIAGTEIIGTETALNDVRLLAIVDVVNALDWLIIVALLEIEVVLQLKDKLTSKLMFFFKYTKGFFYIVLFICAAYWALYSSFLDFWDAFLWLVAFIFIELNIFQWHSETEEEKEQVMKVQSGLVDLQ